MFDSSAKLTAGVLNGNVNQFGDFDECQSAVYEDDDMKIEPQYCLAYLQPEIASARTGKIRNIHKLIQGNYMIYSTFDDVSVIFYLNSIN